MTSENWPAAFACPHCETAVESREGAFACNTCGRNFPVTNGVPRFVEDQPYWGEMPEEVMREALGSAREKGWADALGDALPAGRGETFEYLTNPVRARWAHYLPIKEGGLVLDIGSGLGAIAVGIAQHGYNVVAAEPVGMRAEFLKIRTEQEGIDNLHPLSASVFEIPFADGTFDGIIMNNVLEWVAYSKPDLAPGDAQQAALEYLYRKLKPGGYLHLVIENRWGPVLFAGMKDPHGALRFTTILPRRAANLYTKLRLSEPYKTYLYSRRGYRKLLRRAGFENPHFNGMMPSSRNYFYYFPVESPGVMKNLLRTSTDPKHPTLSRLTNFAARLPLASLLFRQFIPDFSIIARRPE